MAVGILSLLPTRNCHLVQKPSYDISRNFSRRTSISVHVLISGTRTQRQTQSKGCGGWKFDFWVCRRGKQRKGRLGRVWEVLSLNFWQKMKYSALCKETRECKATEVKWWVWKESKYSRSSVIHTSKIKGHFYTLNILLRRVLKYTRKRKCLSLLSPAVIMTMTKSNIESVYFG